MGLTFGVDRVCRKCGGSGKTKHLTVWCEACKGSGLEPQFANGPQEQRLDLAHPTREGERLRDEGIAKVVAAEPSWTDVALRWIEHRPTGERFDAQAVTDAVGTPEHSNAVGAVFGIASRRGWIKPVGIVQSSRPQRHAGRILEWERVR